jgi:hypothetical protein
MHGGDQVIVSDGARLGGEDLINTFVNVMGARRGAAAFDILGGSHGLGTPFCPGAPSDRVCQKAKKVARALTVDERSSDLLFAAVGPVYPRTDGITRQKSRAYVLGWQGQDGRIPSLFRLFSTTGWGGSAAP